MDFAEEKAFELEAQREVERKRLKREKELKDIRHVLSTPAGRRFVWRLLGKSNLFASIAEDLDRLEYKSGWQDFGHFLWGEIAEASTGSLIKMMKESEGGNYE